MADKCKLRQGQKFLARAASLVSLILAIKVSCHLDAWTYSTVVLASAVVIGVSLFLILVSSESSNDSAADQNLKVAREAHALTQEILRARGHGGNGPSMFDGAARFSDSLGSGKSLMMAGGIGVMVSTVRVLDLPRGCGGFSLGAIGINITEIVIWSFLVAGCLVAVRKWRN